jgi:hypothetical protein
MNFDRSFYMPKAESLKPVDPDGSDAAVYTYEENGKLYAVAFYGKAAKPAWHYRFSKAETRAQRIAEFIASRKARATMKAERKAERAKPHSLKVGDILVSSWGYEQTNIDYYEVIEVKGASTVVIREIAQEREQTGWEQFKAMPAPGEYTGEPMVKRATSDNIVRIYSFAHAYKWDGRPHSGSSYH